MIEEETKRVKAWFVSDRSLTTLRPLIVDNLLLGTIVHTDGWRSYKYIQWKKHGLIHKRHVHYS